MITTICMIFFAWIMISHICLGQRPDSTDAKGKHSGMRVLVDNKTKKQYLTTFAGGMTPRLDAQGNHMGVDDDR